MGALGRDRLRVNMQDLNSDEREKSNGEEDTPRFAAGDD